MTLKTPFMPGQLITNKEGFFCIALESLPASDQWLVMLSNGRYVIEDVTNLQFVYLPNSSSACSFHEIMHIPSNYQTLPSECNASCAIEVREYMSGGELFYLCDKHGKLPILWSVVQRENARRIIRANLEGEKINWKKKAPSSELLGENP